MWSRATEAVRFRYSELLKSDKYASCKEMVNPLVYGMVYWIICLVKWSRSDQLK